MLLRIVLRSCTRLVCSLYIFTVGNTELPLSKWPYPHHWPIGLPKMDMADQYTHYIIVLTGEKFYMIDLVYFPTPTEGLQNLLNLNDPTVVVATFNWCTSYHSLQILYAEPDEEDPNWEATDYQLFIF